MFFNTRKAPDTQRRFYVRHIGHYDTLSMEKTERGEKRQLAFLKSAALQLENTLAAGINTPADTKPKDKLLIEALKPEDNNFHTSDCSIAFKLYSSFYQNVCVLNP